MIVLSAVTQLQSNAPGNPFSEVQHNEGTKLPITAPFGPNLCLIFKDIEQVIWDTVSSNFKNLQSFHLECQQAYLSLRKQWDHLQSPESRKTPCIYVHSSKAAFCINLRYDLTTRLIKPKKEDQRLFMDTTVLWYLRQLVESNNEGWFFWSQAEIRVCRLT